MSINSTTAEPTKDGSFPFTDAEVQAFQEVGRQMAYLGRRLAEDPGAARNFLNAAITADRNGLMKHCGDGAKPYQVRPVARAASEMGVREASCQLRFNVGTRFRFFLGLEEQ